MWKDIAGYEGLYQVSDQGEIRSLDKTLQIRPNCIITRKGKIMKPEVSNKGYLRIILYKNDKKKHFSIHRLVAKAFIPNPENLDTINHKDENKFNNAADNLEWMSLKSNINYGTGITKRSNSKKKKVNQFSKDGIFIKTWDSGTEAEKELDLSKGQVCSCCKLKQKSAGGYIWKYAD